MSKAIKDKNKLHLLKINKLQKPKLSDCLLLLGWVAYFIMYYLTESLISADKCHVVHSFIDDIIPFCEVFVIPYVLWYPLIAGSLLYFLFFSPNSFRRLQIYIMIVQAIATVIFIVYPSIQLLRPEAFPRDNFLTDIVAGLYSADTNTGVCPSLHVAISLGIASAWVKEKSASIYFKSFIVVFALLICLATMFIKQHSAVDFFVALPVCLVAEIAVFGKSYWLTKFKK